MPWSPAFSDAVFDPRLDSYRNRAARLMVDGRVAGYVLVESDFRAECRGGMLWWRKWAAPSEFAVIFTRTGEDEPVVSTVEAEDFAIFERWNESGFVDAGLRLTPVWLDDAESQQVHDGVFAHQH